MKEAIIFSILLAGIVIGIQTILFRQTQKKVLHLLPLIVIGGIYIVALAFVIADLDNEGGVAINIIFAQIISVINTIALASDGVAWLIQVIKNRISAQ